MIRIDASTLSRLLGDWADADASLPEALARGIRDVIDAGLLPAGSALPSQRALASALGISRGTVTAAIAVLTARGVVVSTQGSGSRIRSGPGAGHLHEGRMFSFTSSPRDVIDLSTGALPASCVARAGLREPVPDVAEYLHTDGYFPAGLPVLRNAIAHYLTDQGVPTRPEQVLVTSGAQHGTHLALSEILRPGDLALTEDPSYRGGLAALRQLGARVEGIPLRDGGLDVDLVHAAARRGPALLYCQTSIHNPSGTTMAAPERQRLASVINRHGLVTVEDACSRDLTLSGRPAEALATLVEPDLLVMVGTFSKLFWGGIRIGWLRAVPWRIAAFLERRQVTDLACSITDQLYAVHMLQRASEAIAERTTMLRRHLASTEALLREHCPGWTWEPVRGGSGLWVDTGENSTCLAERAKRRNVRLVAGPAFSPHGGHPTRIRLPLWHEADHLGEALGRIG